MSRVYSLKGQSHGETGVRCTRHRSPAPSPAARRQPGTEPLAAREDFYAGFVRVPPSGRGVAVTSDAASGRARPPDMAAPIQLRSGGRQQRTSRSCLKGAQADFGTRTDGLAELFKEPNLKGISNDTLAVSAVEHQSVMDLNEEGVEAAGVTAVVVTRSLLSFSVNRPFIFLLYDNNFNLPLFQGYVRLPDHEGGKGQRSEIKKALKIFDPK